jgi:hypothetical protein
MGSEPEINLHYSVVYQEHRRDDWFVLTNVKWEHLYQTSQWPFTTSLREALGVAQDLFAGRRHTSDDPRYRKAIRAVRVIQHIDAGGVVWSTEGEESTR